MSFILDALKKSESDRQRQTGPALFEVKVAPPRTRLPLWAIAIAVLLAVNLAIVMWMVLRHPAHAAADAAAPGASTALNAPRTSPVQAAGTPDAASAPAATGASPPATNVVASAAPPAAAGAAAAVGGSAAPSPAVSPPAESATRSAAAQGAALPAAAASGSASEPSNPEDYAPAQESSSEFGSHVRRSTAEGVPLYQDAAAVPGTKIPQLRLDLHVFAVKPQDRFVMINMHKLREGDALPEGVRVESITPDGAVLSYNGSRFLLPRE